MQKLKLSPPYAQIEEIISTGDVGKLLEDHARAAGLLRPAEPH